MENGPVDPVRRRIPGRRHGRRLRKGLRVLVDGLLPRISLSLADGPLSLDPRTCFGPEISNYWIEIGFGSGEHLAWQAAHNPDIGFFGAEIYVNGIAGLLRQVDNDRLSNIRVYQGDGRDLLAQLPDASISRIAALFPDPWPKERHHKRRLIRRGTLDQMARVLKDGGELRLATDHAEYLVWMLERLHAHPSYDWLAGRPADWRARPEGWPSTRYEEKAVADGRPPVFLRFCRRPR